MAKLLQEKLFSEKKNGMLKLSDDETAKVDEFCEDYKHYLDNAKTEREAVNAAIEIAKANGFKEYDRSAKYTAGEKVYYNNRGKSVILCVFGTEPLENAV